MSDDYLSKVQVDAIKVELRTRIVDALRNKGHLVEAPENAYIRSVDGQPVDVEFRSWGEPRSYGYRSTSDTRYAKSVQVTVSDGSYRRGCDYKTSRRTKKDGKLPEVDLAELVLAIENVVNSKVSKAAAEVQAKSSRDAVLEFLIRNNIEIKYGESYIGKAYSDSQGKVKVSDSGSMNFSLYVPHDNLEKAKKVIDFIQRLNLEDAHEAGLADSEAA